MVNWRDIQERAEKFVFRYVDAKDEDRDAKPFWKDLLEIFGVDPRQIGAFEERVRIHGRPGVAKIDYFAPRKFIIEHKSRGKDLDAAYKQAMDYFDALQKSERPQYIIVSDFANFRIYNLEADELSRMTEFTLEELPKHIQSLAFFAEEGVRVYKPEEPIDVKAVRAIGKLHAALKESNYTPAHIAPFLTRIVFLCFADDTGIFENGSILRYLEENTREDGSDIGSHLNAIFDVLNTAENSRQKNLHPMLENLPYVNGGLFAQPLHVVFASRDIRAELVKCMEFDWSDISPAVFGSMFQSVMDEKERHNLGAHYTSETNILKVVNGLFLEDLHAELESAKTNKEKLAALHEKIAKITLLDPACGCGNFLVISYRELRKIENEIIARIYKQGSAKIEAGHMLLPLGVDVKKLSKLSVEHMYGIEIDPFAAEVAKLSLWLMDHLMNVELGKLFGEPYKKLPLTEAPHIVRDNALTLDWGSVVPKEKLTYILGNPPFLGSKIMSAEQRKEIAVLFHDVPGAGVLDFVTGWYLRAAKYIQGTAINVAFVSTNSITQGEQVGILWKEMTERYGCYIQFAHRTFRWTNEASGKAAVYCVIVGFGLTAGEKQRIFEYDDIKGEPKGITAKHINSYLVDAPDAFILSRSKPISAVPEIGIGNKPIDGGLYLFAKDKKDDFIRDEPGSKKYFRRWIGSDEFLNGYERWCLWLGDAEPKDLKAMPEVMRRIESVRQFRLMSTSAPTRKLAERPTRFHVENMPAGNYLVLPKVSSERRKYIPIDFETFTTLASDLLFIVPNATLYHFGTLESVMHMTWMRSVAGRLKSDYRYSKDIVYNNFPWPENPTAEQKKTVEAAAQAVLDTRAKYTNATLADLYDPNTMPADLLKAHHVLDRAVDACYGKKSFKSEPERLEFLFEKYSELVAKEASLKPSTKPRKARDVTV